ADLPQLSHLALPLIGEGEAEVAGTVLPGAEALARAHLAPLRLGARDALALVSANSATVGRAALVLHDVSALLEQWNGAVALAFDAAAIALAQTAALAVERCIKFMSPAMTGLPLQLTRHGPEESGFATVQKTLTALYNEIRLRANPGSLDFLPVSERIED